MDLAKDWDSYIKRCEKAKAHYDQHYSFEGNKTFWMKMVQSPTKLYMVVNEDRFFLSHRKDIAIEAVKNAYEVCIICKDTGRKQEVLDLGLPMIELPINPTGSNIFENLFIKKVLVPKGCSESLFSNKAPLTIKNNPIPAAVMKPNGTSRYPGFPAFG